MSIKITTKWQKILKERGISLRDRAALQQAANEYKHTQIISPVEEIREHNAQIEAKKKAKLLAKQQRNSL